jgi:hypothetical protein
MERLIIRLTIFLYIGDGVQAKVMSDRYGQRTVILTTIWWWKHLDRLAMSKQTDRLRTKELNIKSFIERRDGSKDG